MGWKRSSFEREKANEGAFRRARWLGRRERLLRVGRTLRHGCRTVKAENRTVRVSFDHYWLPLATWLTPIASLVCSNRTEEGFRVSGSLSLSSPFDDAHACIDVSDSSSQVEGPTQRNTQGFKFSQANETADSTREKRYMSVMSLEVFCAYPQNHCSHPWRFSD